jgi:poly-gamma-glutamate synthesis protein (capsule biosynthesis protein)
MGTNGFLLHRRALLGGGAAAALLGSTARAAPAERLRINLIGQALMRENICAQDWPGRAGLARRLGRADVTISDLEVVIRGPRAGAPTRGAETLHYAEPAVLDCLGALGIGLLNTASNHAFDLNSGGILDTMQALEARGLPFAGTGMTLADAAKAGHVETGAGRVGLVAAAAGFVREGGAATDTRPGVAEIRRGAEGGLNGDDVARTLAAITASASAGATVIAYLHDHFWEAENWRVPDWKRAYARQCINAGAAAFFSHGAPLLQGIETYRGAPIFHGLGSFTFQTKKADDAYGDWAWQSLIAECTFEAGRFIEARLVPVQLDAEGTGGPDDLATRGRPRLATGREATAILDRADELSAGLGQTLVREDDTALLRA